VVGQAADMQLATKLWEVTAEQVAAAREITAHPEATVTASQ
jgi:hypothetical protein